MPDLLKLLFLPTAEVIGEELEYYARNQPRDSFIFWMIVLAVLLGITYGVSVPGFGWLGALAFCAALVLVFWLRLGTVFFYSVLGAVVLKLVHGSLASLLTGYPHMQMTEQINNQNWLVLASVIFVGLLPLVLLRRALSNIGQAFAQKTERVVEQ